MLKMLPFIMLLYYLSMLGNTGWELEQLTILCPSFIVLKRDLVASLARGQKWLDGNFTEHPKGQLLWYESLFLLFSNSPSYFLP